MIRILLSPFRVEYTLFLLVVYGYIRTMSTTLKTVSEFSL